MKRKFFFSVVLSTAVLTLALPLAACSDTTPETSASGYIIDTLEIWGTSFSFEHLPDYQKGTLNPYGEDEEAEYAGMNYIASTEDNIYRRMMSIQLWHPSEALPDARARLDYYVDNLENVGPNAEVIERTALQVGGVDGEKLVFMSVIEEITDIPNLLTGWIAAFDYQGQIFFIAVTTNIAETDEVQADFEHLIESFRFLD